MRNVILLLTCASALTLMAQEPNPTQQGTELRASSGQVSPIYRVHVVARTTKAVNYGHRSAPTTIDLAGTLFLPEAEGVARVRSHKGAVEVEATFKKLEPPHRFGREYLTYVLWAVTPEGRATNLGEIVTNGKNKGKLQTATELQSFALIVTAEPYFSVTQPSDVVVMENVVRPDTLGRVETVDAKYELLQRGDYTLEVSAAEGRRESAGRKVSLKEYEATLALYEARNAVQVAEAQGAAEHAGDSLEKARRQLKQAEAHYARDKKSRTVVMLGREAAQTAEDARLITLRRRRAVERSREESVSETSTGRAVTALQTSGR